MPCNLPRDAPFMFVITLRFPRIVLCAVAAWLVVYGDRCASVATEVEIDFNRDVRPILSDRCFACHGPDAQNQASEFRVDTLDRATADLGGYAGIVPSDLDASELHLRIRDEDDPMPPADALKQLTEAEKDILDQWIRQGAQFDSHWAFKPLPLKVDVPDAGEGWARGPLDRFIAQAHDDNGLSANVPA